MQGQDFTQSRKIPEKKHLHNLKDWALFIVYNMALDLNKQ